VNDIPNIVAQANIKYPHLEIKITTHIGASNLMMDLICSIAEKH
jgi:hypothetical protein